MSLSRWAAVHRTALCLSALLLSGCGAPTCYFLNDSSDAIEVKEAETAPFLLFADTQFSIPATDYDLRPDVSGLVVRIEAGVSAKKAGTFYRHAAANAVLPDALDSVLTQAEKDGYPFAVFAGDLVEFACMAEAERMFAVLEKHPKIPVLIAPGNHDVLFHGSWDTDAVKAEGSGAWDANAWNIWGHVCAQQEGRLTKEAFIRRLATYYERVMGIELALDKLEPNIARSTSDQQDPLPVLQKGPWRLEYGVKLSQQDVPTSHRQSHLFQRFNYQSEDKQAVVTLLDTVDYSDRRTLCEGAGMLLQLGMSGSMSNEQLDWLEAIKTPPPGHFIAAHYLPFSPVWKQGACDSTAGTNCRRARGVLERYSQSATVIYGHVHRDYQAQELEIAGTESKRAVVRVPSLIDNKSYVTFDGKTFAPVALQANPAFVSEAPFTKEADTCTQRVREVAELGRNLACFLGEVQVRPPRGWSAPPKCEDLDAAQAALEPVGAKACKSPAPANLSQCQAFGGELWRCVLRDWMDELLNNLPADRRGEFARAQLQVAKTLRAK